MKIAIIRPNKKTREIELTKETGKKVAIGVGTVAVTAGALYGYHTYTLSTAVIEAFVCR